MHDIDHALAILQERRAGYELYKDYYEGDHALAFATAKYHSAFGSLFEEFADNLCPAVVDALADRLELTGFNVEEGSKTVAESAKKLWQANRMDLRAGKVHLQAIRNADAYVIVWPDQQGTPRIWPNKAEAVTVRYNQEEPDRIEYALKIWRLENNVVRLNLYYPDRIEKYQSKISYTSGLPQSKNVFDRLRVPGEAWPLRNPWGVVPVFHFANNADIGEFGVSELRDVVPIQDALNKSVTDMLVAMEFVSYPQRWATGIEVDIDPATGKPDTTVFHPGINRIWTVANEAAHFGEFSQADLTRFIAVQDSLRLEIARVSGTPLHYMALMSDPPSGEALKTLEARFVKKCRDRQTAFGNVWEDVMQLALRMANKGTEKTRLSSQWVDPAPKSARDEAETQEIKQRVGVTPEQSLMEMGYPDETIKTMMAQKAARQPQIAPMEDQTNE